MKQSRMFAVLVPMLCLALVSAQDAGKGERKGGATPPPAKPAQTTPPAATKGGLSVHSVTDVLGMKVVDQKGEKLGKIEDIVLNSNGEVAYAVLSFKGDFGLSDNKNFAIPWNVLSLSPTDKTLVLPIDKERLKTAPGFDRTQWPIMTSLDWSKEIDTYYANERRSTTGRPIEASSRMGAVPMRASELKGMNVETPTGEKLGDIKEVIVDPNGRINYVVLSVGGFLGVGDRHVAVPWEALKMTREPGEKGKAKVNLNITKEKLEKAPQFESGNDRWTAMSDPVFIGRVYEYYGVRPYWTTEK